MDCAELENKLMPYLDDEIEGHQRLAIDEHVAVCPKCAAMLAGERLFLDTLQAANSSSESLAPPALKHAVANRLDLADSHARRTQFLRLSAMAATLAAVTVAGHQSWKSFKRNQYVEDVVAHHVRRFPMEIERPTNRQIEAWFGGKLDHRVSVPQFPNRVAAGARLLNVREKQAAYIRYDEEQPDGSLPGRMGLFVYGDKVGDVDVGPLPHPEMGSSNGFNVVSWRDGDVVYQLVTDLDEHDLQELLPPRGDVGGAVPVGPASRPNRLEVQPASMQQAR
jgi:anti-sigma factor RsiW